MKKIFFVLVMLFVMPVMVNAATLIKGVNFDGIGELPLNRNTWNLSLTTTLDYVDIDVIPTSDGVTVTGAGKVDVEEGNNKIVFTATDGTTTEEYTVNVKISRPSKDSSGNPETGAFLSFSTLILAGILAIVIYNMKKSRIIKL